jgi:hypothetical protein
MNEWRFHSDWLLLRLRHDWSNCLVELYYDRRSVGQSVLVSSPHVGLMTRFLLLPDHCGFFIWGALSDERTGLSFTMYNIQYILLSQIWDFPNLEVQVPVFISPKNRVARLYPQTLGCLTDLLDCTRRLIQWITWFVFITPGRTECRSLLLKVHVITCLPIVAGTCVNSVVILQDFTLPPERVLASRCVAVDVYSDFTIPAFGRHVTVQWHN